MEGELGVELRRKPGATEDEHCNAQQSEVIIEVDFVAMLSTEKARTVAFFYFFLSPVALLLFTLLQGLLQSFSGDVHLFEPFTLF